jgi:antitoxin ParD1/3/4
MAAMNVSLPASLKGFVDQRVENGGCGLSSEYVRELISRDQVHRAEKKLAELLPEGMESDPAQAVDAAFWVERRSKPGR